METEKNIVNILLAVHPNTQEQIRYTEKDIRKMSSVSAFCKSVDKLLANGYLVSKSATNDIADRFRFIDAERMMLRDDGRVWCNDVIETMLPGIPKMHEAMAAVAIKIDEYSTQSTNLAHDFITSSLMIKDAFARYDSTMKRAFRNAVVPNIVEAKEAGMGERFKDYLIEDFSLFQHRFVESLNKITNSVNKSWNLEAINAVLDENLLADDSNVNTLIKEIEELELFMSKSGNFVQYMKKKDLGDNVLRDAQRY